MVIPTNDRDTKETKMIYLTTYEAENERFRKKTEEGEMGEREKTGTDVVPYCF